MDNTVKIILIILGIIAVCLVLSLLEKGINVIKFLIDGLVGLFKIIIKIIKFIIYAIKQVLRFIFSLITYPFRFVIGERNFMI